VIKNGVQDGVQYTNVNIVELDLEMKEREHLKEAKDIWFDYVFKKQVHRELVKSII